MSGNIVSDDDYFMIKMYKTLPKNIRKTTYNQVQALFDKYKYQYDFKREEIEELFEIKKSRASELIAMLLDAQLITPSEPTKYRFKK